MATKGKDKAGDSDSDSDLDFFTFKPAIAAPKSLTAPTKPKPIHILSSSPEYSSEGTDSDDPDAKKRRKRKRSKSNKPPPTQPSWLAMATLPVKGRGSSRSTERGTSKPRLTPVIDIEVSEEDEAEKERRKRERILAAITPPPMLSAAEKQEVVGLIDSALPMEIPDDDDEDGISGPSTHARRSSPGEASEPDEKVTINIRMTVDPEKRAQGLSERAIARYEKPWSMFVNRRDPLSRMIGDLADKISKGPKELIVEYNGAKIPHSFTPLRLGIQANEEVGMSGYELAVYEKVQEERAAKREGLHAAINAGGPVGEDEDGDAGEGEKEGDDEAGDAGSGDDGSEAKTTEKKGTILRLRGRWGEATIRVADNIALKLLAGHYCKRVGHAGSEGDVHLEFDGDKLEPETLVGDLGVEDRDMIDVICP